MSEPEKSTAYGWIGRGIYAPSEAARLLQVPAEKLLQWALGRSWVSRGAFRELKPALVAKVAHLDGLPTLSFADLIELLFVKGFRDKGLSLQHIRAAAEKAAAEYGVDHPFTMKSFATDGRKIFATLAEQGGDQRLLELVSSQFAIPEVLERYLSQLKYDVATGAATHWWPRGAGGRVLIDPRISFGSPTVRGVPTTALASAFEANGRSAARVAGWYNVDADDVDAAVDYEHQLSLPAAA